ncbi:uncharacterized protein TNCV_1213631 [Trichonephila clavipes]|nr:uncharacterized protein TNCV_1213631 [Trichonephila clavipes]
MGDRSVHRLFPFQPKLQFSPYVHIERTRDSHYLPYNVHEIDNYVGGGLMVWAGIMSESRTPLRVFERGSVTGVRYRDEVLEPYVHLFRGSCGPEFILMNDSARPRRVLQVAVWIGQLGLQISTI